MAAFGQNCRDKGAVFCQAECRRSRHATSDAPLKMMAARARAGFLGAQIHDRINDHDNLKS